VARGTFSKSVILHHFPNFYTLRVEIFWIFYPFTSTYDPYEPRKLSWKSVRTFLRNPEDRHTDRQTRQLYIHRNIAKDHVTNLEDSNLENRVAVRTEDDDKSDDEYRQIGRQRHHPANQIRPQRVLLIPILHRVILDEAEHKDCLQTGPVSTRKC